METVLVCEIFPWRVLSRGQVHVTDVSYQKRETDTAMTRFFTNFTCIRQLVES